MSNDQEFRDELLNLASGLGEVAIDSTIDTELFKDIPIIGSAISLIKIGKSLSDELLLIKIKHFLNQLDIKTPDEIDEFKEKYLKNTDYNRIGSKLLLEINQSTEAKRLEWLANALIAHVDGVIPQHEYLRITEMIKSIGLADVDYLELFREKETVIVSEFDLLDPFFFEQLVYKGFIQHSAFDEGDARSNSSSTEYRLTYPGNLFLQFILKPN